jgi:predicted nucleic acid-binding protein
MVYVDTSVLVAYYCPEPLSGKAETFLISQDKPVINTNAFGFLTIGPLILPSPRWGEG